MKKIVLCLIAIFLFSSDALAQSISTTQALSFGEAVLKNNDAVHEIVISRNGNFSADPDFVFITDPQVGIYEITGGGVRQRLDTVTVTVNQQLTGAGKVFTIDNFDIQSPNQLSNTGTGTIRVGARMQSSGDGTPYNPSTTHNGTLTLEVTFQ